MNIKTEGKNLKIGLNQIDRLKLTIFGRFEEIGLKLTQAQNNYTELFNLKLKSIQPQIAQVMEEIEKLRHIQLGNIQRKL